MSHYYNEIYVGLYEKFVQETEYDMKDCNEMKIEKKKQPKVNLIANAVTRLWRLSVNVYWDFSHITI